MRRKRQGRRLRVDAAALLRELGIRVRRSGHGEYRGHCPDPAHANRPGSSAQLKRGPGTWQIRLGGDLDGQHVCYACKFGGGPHALVRAVLGLAPKEAYEWLLSFTGEAAPGDVRLAHWTRKLPPPEGHRFLTLPENTLPLWGEVPVEVADARAYVLSRGLSDAEIRRYQIGATPADAPAYAQRVIVPVVVKGELVDYVARLYVKKPETISKALSGRRDLGARKELALWGYDALDPTIGTVTVVEGVWGAVAAIHAGLPNVISSCGSAWSEERTELLRPWEEVVLIPDGDAAGDRFEDLAYASLRFTHRVRRGVLGAGLQPDHEVVDLVRVFEDARPARLSGTAGVAVAGWAGKR